MKHVSIWQDEKQKEICPSLTKDLEIDVLIIGGGLTGISTAYHLIGSNLKVCLVERNEIGSGVTSRTTGKISYIQENIYFKINSYHGIDKAKLYLESQIDATNIIKDIVNKNNIDCNFEQVSSYIVNNCNGKFSEEKNILKSLDIKISESNKLPNADAENSFYVDDTYVFHPLKYLYSLKDICLKNNINIYENTKINKVNKENDY